MATASQQSFPTTMSSHHQAGTNQVIPKPYLSDRPSREQAEEAEEAVRTMIRWAGDDPSRGG